MTANHARVGILGIGVGAWLAAAFIVAVMERQFEWADPASRREIQEDSRRYDSRGRTSSPATSYRILRGLAAHPWPFSLLWLAGTVAAALWAWRRPSAAVATLKTFACLGSVAFGTLVLSTLQCLAILAGLSGRP